MVVHQSVLSQGGTRFVTHIQKDGSWDFHFHKNFEILYVMEGELSCTVNRRTRVLKKGEYSMCLPNEIHAGKSIGETVLWSCIFSEDYVSSFAKLTENKQGSDFVFTCAPHLQNYLDEVFLNEKEQDLFTQKSCLYALCGAYLSAVTLTEKNKLCSDAMAAILEYTAEHYKRDVRLSDLAAALNYDYHYLSRLFHTLFGMSFPDFISTYRMEAAAELLREGDKKMVDIAYECGFGSVRSFNDRFKALHGISPTEYKKRCFETLRGKE